MDKFMVTMWILMAVVSITAIFLMVFNRPLYCKISMMGGLGQVPAMCLQDALRELKN